MKDGKPDHEAAPHAKWKHDLASRAEAMMKANNVQVQPTAAKEEIQKQLSDNFKQPDSLANPFDMSQNAPEVKKPVA